MGRARGSFYASYGKRVLDFALSALALVLLSPIILAIAAAIRLTMGRPIFFRQERTGYGGRPFSILKFRSMSDARDAAGNLLPDSRRVTRIGKLLRATSIDELPELVNVLKGDMSLVGPRPLITRYYPYFTETERARFLVRPGITGAAQIAGRNDLPWDARLAADLEYARRASFGLDLKILLITAWRVCARHGLRVDPMATMADFDQERRERLAAGPAASGQR